jgi:ubiquinone/menaquinone biosynthesis C-methylase UbiE
MEEYKPDVSKVLDKNIQMYDTYYQKPDWWFRFRYDTQVKRKTCLYLLKQAGRSLNNQRVLEIGFGSGATLFSFAPSCEIFGLEISHSAVKRAQEKARKLGYRASRFEMVQDASLPYPQEYFDVIIASHVVEHVEDDQRLLREISRVLKPNGVAVLLIPINEIYDDPNHIHRYTSLEFVEVAQRCALRVAYPIENELLFHLVEKFYFEAFNYRWKIFGPLIAALFNFPTSLLPFWGYQVLDRAMIRLGWKPRQFGGVFNKVFPVRQR